MTIRRRKSRQVKIGNVRIGGRAPVSIQSMITSDVRNVSGAIKEIEALKREGSDIVRMAVVNQEAARALREIKKRIKIPLVADIHFNWKLAIAAIDNGADAIRLNPGNITKRPEVQEVVRMAKRFRIPVRIGVNSGSLIRRRLVPNSVRQGASEAKSRASAMVQSALDYLKIFEKLNFREIIVSLKSSDVLTTVYAYRLMARVCDYPFHLGVTAAGNALAGVVKSAIGIGALLADGLGDTIRVSLTGDSLEEVRVAKQILSSLGLKKEPFEIISCPTCSRCEIDLPKIVEEVKKGLGTPTLTLTRCKGRLAGVRPIKVAIMGCAVNGPGEARDADVGLAGGKKRGIIFRKGKRIKEVKEETLVEELVKEIFKETRSTVCPPKL